MQSSEASAPHSLVFVGNVAMSPAEAYQLCGGKLLCQDGPARPPVLMDFGKDYGLIGPSLFLHRLVADSRNPLSRYAAPSGAPVHLSEKRQRPASSPSVGGPPGRQ